MALNVRPATRDELRSVHENLGIAFGFDSSEESFQHFEPLVDLERTRCAFDGDAMVGTLACFSLELTVPGGTLPTAGTTWVSVLPTHRRRGALRAMMRAHIDDVRDRGEPLAALWASESAIYERFGYGLAAYLCALQIDRPHARFARPVEAPGRVRILGADEARRVLPATYEPLRFARPGCFARWPAWWEHHRFWDPLGQRGGATPFHFAVYEEDGNALGYLQYRIKPRAEHGLPSSVLQIVELQAPDPSASAALWRYALDVDLMARIEAWNRPVDDTLPWCESATSRRIWLTI